ncbi:MAG: hypothetical protein JO332_09100 [Planctomycetaceae bacterium]|nr:hypothetical protein [Planctomycetaceae bacterium]
MRKTAAILAVLALGGCGLFSKSEDRPVQQVTTKNSPESPEITVGELDQLSRNYSDRLVARVSTACDQIKADAADAAARSKAHQLKLTVALDAYDIVTSPGGSGKIPGAAQHVLDLAILTELNAVRWIEEKAARDAFGDRGAERIGEALSKSREDIWAITGRVMKPQLIDQLKTFILHWRQQNPKVEWVSRVRLDVVAQHQEGAAFTNAVGQGFNPLRPALQAVDETRITVQQALFYFKRMPILLDWTTEATVANALDVPKVSTLVQGLTETLGSVRHLTGTFEHLMEPSSQEPAINSTIGGVKETLSQATVLMREVRGLQEALQPVLDRMKAAKDPNAKTMDVERVTENVEDVARETTTLIRETKNLAESPSAVKNVDEMLGHGARSISRAGTNLIDHATWRALLVVGVIAAIVIAYKVVAALLRRRRPKPATP